mgnify:FL=1
MSDFVSFASACGLQINSLRTGDKIFRCPTVAHPKYDNGAYFFNGERGWCQNWETGEPAQWWNSDRVSPWGEAEKREWAAQRRLADKVQQDLRRNAAAKAAAMIKTASVDVSPYLKYKSHPEAKALVLADGGLLVPMRDFRDNSLRGCQIIKLVDNEWEKKMIYGMQAKGAVFRIGSQTLQEVFLCEGYATALSIDLALRMSCLRACVVACFSASNLVFVAENMTGKRFVFADNDKSDTGEKAAIETGLPYCMSDVIGEDANDLHVSAGLMAVQKKIMEVRRK